MSAAAVAPTMAATPVMEKPLGQRVNGKNWKDSKRAFRPTAGLTPYEKRLQQRKELEALKEKEREMKEEKEAERQRHIQAIKDRRAVKEEKLRYQMMAEKMHKKKVERRKRKEKRNKLLNS